MDLLPSGLHDTTCRLRFGYLACFPRAEVFYPEYMPSGQVTFRDSDGYVIGINQWGETQHSAWLRALEGKRKSGALPARG